MACFATTKLLMGARKAIGGPAAIFVHPGKISLRGPGGKSTLSLVACMVSLPNAETKRK